MTTIGKLAVKTTAQIRDDYLRTLANGYAQAGLPNPQVGPGTDDYLKATAVANAVTPLYSNTQIQADAQMPDTATGVVAPGQSVGADLQRIGAIVGIQPRLASSSAGFISLVTSSTTSIPSTAQLTDAAGLRYAVAASGTYANGALVPIVSIDTGATTNHVAGDILTWVTAPFGCAQKQSVAVGGLTGGAAAETNDSFRARVIARYQNPPGSGNAAQIALYASQSTPIVQMAAVYPAVNGPSTVHVAVTAAPSSVSVTRAISSTILNGTVIPYILGQVPEYAETIITGTVDVPTDISIGMALPASATSQPPGPGGGWVDGTPWPQIGGIQNYANVTSVTSSTVFTINAPTAPSDGISHISFFDPTNLTLYSATVLSHTGAAGAFIVTIDTPFTNIAAALALGGTGPLIWPSAVNGATYVATLLAAMAVMGPGEKTANAGVLSRGYRHPLPSQSWPYSLNATILKLLENAGPEVLDVQWNYRSTITPAVPASVALAPNILVPRHIGIYAE